MIMRPGQPLLLPASPWFIWASLLGAFLLNMLITMGWAGRGAWTPDLLAIALVFWAVHQPLRIGVGIAFFFGLGMDVHQSALLGQHALAYTALIYLAIVIHRRMLWFDLLSQSLHILPLFALATALQVLVRLLAGDGLPGWDVLLAPVLETLLWPVASALLLAPQRRAHDPDETRPI